jgi:hypothetical protein
LSTAGNNIAINYLKLITNNAYILIVRQLVEHLKDKFEQRTLKQQDELRKKYLANVRHSLRTLSYLSKSSENYDVSSFLV